MAFPDTPLPLSVWYAPGADPVDPSGWNFTEITSDVRTGQGVQIQVGRTDEATQVGATRVGLTLDNRAGDYSPRNPTGANFGLLGKGTPIEVRVTLINDTFTRSGALGTDADSGLTWTTTNSTWATTGSAATSTLASANTVNLAVVEAGGPDVEVTHTSSLSAVATGAAWVDATVVRHSSNSNFYMLHTEFGTGGVISCKIERVLDGVTTTLAATTSTGVSYSAGTAISTRVRAVGTRLQVRAWLASDDEPTTWTCEADDNALDAISTKVGLYEWRMAGNTNVGSMTCTIDDFRSDVIRAITPVPEWPIRWDKSGNDATVPLIGAGILRRLGQGGRALRSPIYRQLSAQPAAGYWPLEDGSDATDEASSALSRGKAARCVDVTFGSSDAPAGSASAATLTSWQTSRVTGEVTSWSLPTNGYAAMLYARQPTLSGSPTPVVGNRLMQVDAVGTVTQWTVYSIDTNFYVQGRNSSGTLIVDTGAVAFGMDPTEWYAIQLETEESGGNVNWTLLWHQVGSTSFYSQSGTYAGTADRVTRQIAYAPVDGTLICHMWCGDDALEFVDSDFMKVSYGYTGELAGDRLVRLCTEHNIPLHIIGDTADTTPMEAQPPDTLPNLLRQCEDADQGVLHERGAGLGYRTRRHRMNRREALTLDFDEGHIAEPPEPVDDDQQLRNAIRLRNLAGVEVIAEDDASIAADGEYPDELQVSVQSVDDLTDHAWWRLHLGSHGELRWPRIELDLARNPDLISNWCAVRIGSRILIDNPPDQIGGDQLDLLVEGWTETLSDDEWRVVLVCSPAAPWLTGVYDGSSAYTPRYDLATCTTSAEYGSAATTLVLDIADDLEEWSATSAYDLLIAGELIGVPIGGMSAKSSGQQTLTGAVRSKNGVVKTLPSGSPVRVATPGRWAI